MWKETSDNPKRERKKKEKKKIKRKEGKVPQLQEFCCIEVYFS